jgi:hypothetical protein
MTVHRSVRSAVRPIAVALFAAASIGCASESGDWDAAQSDNTVAAYEQFIEKYPAGEFVAEAQRKIESLYLEKARAAGTIEAFEEFMTRFPDGSFTREAKTGILTIEAGKARSAGTASAYADLVSQYSEGELASKAEELIHDVFPAFTEESVLGAERVSDRVRDGAVHFKAGRKPDSLEVLIEGSIPVVDGTWCLCCVKTVQIDPLLRIPLTPFFRNEQPPLHAGESLPAGLKLSTKVEGPLASDESDCIVSGPSGVTLVKEPGGFRLMKGRAYLFKSQK